MVGAGKGRKREQNPERDEEGIRVPPSHWRGDGGVAWGVEARAPAARALVARASEATVP